MKGIYTKLRLGRAVLSTVVTLLIIAGMVYGRMWLCNRMQLGPALLAGAGLWIVFWIMLTTVLGRIYCSVACPVGWWMDVATWVHRRLRPRWYLRWVPASNWLRYTVLAVCVLTDAFGLTVIVDLLEPYSLTERIVTVGSATVVSAMAMGCVAGLVTVSGWSRGRLWCNTMCPIGAILSICSRNSEFHPDINTDLCINCGKCEDICKSQCINLRDHVVDASRCVTCFDCMSVCPNNAITYRRGRHRLVTPMLHKAPGPVSGSTSATTSAQ